MEPVLFGGTLLFEIYLLGRTTLLLIGRFKGHVLNFMGRYGDEPLFHPLSNFVLSLIRIVILAFLIARLRQRPYSPSVWELDPFLFLLFLLFLWIGIMQPIALIYLKRRFPKLAARIFTLLAYYPYWYRELLSRTSRYERRRISYMWLRMPTTTRAAFDLYTDSFLQWADMIIMGTVMEEDAPSSVKTAKAGSYFDKRVRI